MQLYLFAIPRDKEYFETALFLCKYCAGEENAMSSADLSFYLIASEETIRKHIEEANKDGYPILSCPQGFYVPDGDLPENEGGGVNE